MSMNTLQIHQFITDAVEQVRVGVKTHNDKDERFRAQMPKEIEFELPQDNGAILKFTVNVLDYPWLESK